MQSKMRSNSLLEWLTGFGFPVGFELNPSDGLYGDQGPCFDDEELEEVYFSQGSCFDELEEVYFDRESCFDDELEEL